MKVLNGRDSTGPVACALFESPVGFPTQFLHFATNIMVIRIRDTQAVSSPEVESGVPDFRPSARLLSKVLSYFCRNLAGRHLVRCFNTDDASTESSVRDTFLELSLGLTRAEEQDRFCITDIRNNLVMRRRSPLPCP